jgi:hypothetical protein
LSVRESSRSFADMRVEILANFSLPEASGPAPENRALQAFLAAVNAEDSLFRVTACSPEEAQPSAAAELHPYAQSVLLCFSEDALNRKRGLYFTLIERLAKLLQEAGSSDSLEVRLGLTGPPESGSRTQEHKLVIELVSRGASAEQAQLRWGLGIVHIQQALLFSSRLLRKDLSSHDG